MTDCRFDFVQDIVTDHEIHDTGFQQMPGVGIQLMADEYQISGQSELSDGLADTDVSARNVVNAGGGTVLFDITAHVPVHEIRVIV